MAQKKSGEPSFRSYVLWDLKLRGNINENHNGGNALETLRDRLKAHGAPVEKAHNLSTVVAQLHNAGKIHRVTKGRRTHIIRLRPDVDLPVNPYGDHSKALATRQTVVDVDAVEDVADAELLPVEDQSLMNGHRDWPISKRLQLIAELSQSVHEDIEKAKASL